MMLSMTGYGRGYAEERGNSVTVEVSAVNHKHRDIRFNLPPELTILEGKLKGRVAETVTRGSVYISLEYELSPEYKAAQTTVNKRLAGRLIEDLKEIAAENGLDPEIAPEALLNVPGIVEVQARAFPSRILENLGVEALEEALNGLTATRRREGEELRKDFARRLENLQRLLEQIEANRGEVLHAYKEQLQQRIRELGVEVPVNDQRLAQEAAYAAQKADITEEVTRLKAHLLRFKTDLSGSEPVGRELYFVTQEILREINTLGSKTRDTDVADHAINFKTELERIREQVLNIE